MSFMSPKTESPMLSPSTPGRTSTYQEAEAIPFLTGYGRVAPKWITDRFNDHWSNGKMTGQAYCSVAGVLSHGPVDHVRAFFKAGEIEGAFYADRPTNPADPSYYYMSFAFGGPDKELGPTCIGRVYWGREDQPADSWLRAKTGQDHPPYPGLCYVVFERLPCGQITAGTQAKPALPSCEFSVYRLPSETLPAGLRIPSAVSGSMFRGVNPISALYDILSHPRAGLAMTSTGLDAADWTSKAIALEAGTKAAAGAYGINAYISPLLTGGAEAEQVITDALSYVDGWIYSYANKLRVDWFPNDGTIPASITELSEHDMADEPQVKTAALIESPSMIVVSCLDGGPGAGVDLIDAVEQAAVPFVRELTGEASVKKLDRPWITNRDIAAGYAARYASCSTIPEMEGECTVRLDRSVRPDGTPLSPGDIIRVNWAPSSLLVVSRITELLEDDASVKIRWKRERGMASLPYVPSADPRQNYATPDPDVLAATDWQIVETPEAFGASTSLVIFARRPNLGLLGIKAYLDEDGDWASGSTYLGTQPFCAAGSLASTITASGLTLDISGTDADLSPALGSGMTAADQANNTLLAIIDGEWCSIGTVSTVSAGVYRLSILRARFGSTAIAHSAGAKIWVSRYDRLNILSHASFTEGMTRYIKLQTYNAKTDSAMSAAQSLVLRTRALGAPDVLLVNLTKETHALPATNAGVVTDYTGASGQMTVRCNGVDVTGLAALSVASLDGSTTTITSAGAYSTTAVSKSVTTVVLRASYRGRTIDSNFSLSKTLAGSPGPGGDGLTCEYSIDGASNWHSAFTVADQYRRERVGLGAWQVMMIGPSTSVINTAKQEAVSEANTASSAAIATEAATRAAASEALATGLAQYIANLGDHSAAVQILTEAYVTALGEAVAQWGIDLNVNNEAVGMKMTAKRGGVQGSLSELVFNGLILRSANYVAGVSGWKGDNSGNWEVNQLIARAGIISQGMTLINNSGLVFNPNFEHGTEGWEANPEWSIESTAGEVGWGARNTSGLLTGLKNNYWVAVMPGDSYRAKARVYGASTGVAIIWFNSSKTEMTSNITFSGGGVAGAWATVSCVGVAPEGACFARLMVFATTSGDKACNAKLTEIVSLDSIQPPSISPAPGLQSGSITVTASATAGATIKYTVDGTSVNPTSPTFPGGGLVIDRSTTLRVRAWANNGASMSSEVIAPYTLNSTTAVAATPSLTISSGTFGRSAVGITPTCATSGAGIFFSVNGAAYSQWGSGIISIPLGGTLSMYASVGGMTPSNTMTIANPIPNGGWSSGGVMP